MSAGGAAAKAIGLHAAVIALLFGLNFVLPDYLHGVLARVMVLSVFAMGYNYLFGYAGLLSLRHAMFFAAGLYGAGLTVFHLGWGMAAGFGAGLAAGAALSLAAGLLALRTSGVALMIVTMMFAQVVYLLVLYFGRWTRGDEGLVIPQQARAVEIGGDYRCSLDRSLHTIDVLTSILKSAEEGKAIEIRTTCTQPAAFGIDEAKALLR